MFAVLCSLRHGFGRVRFAASRDNWAQDVRHICSGKYQDAKAAGTLNGETWPQFYSKCAAEAKANPAAAAPAAAAPLDVRHICSGKYQDAKAAGTLNGEAWPQFYSRCVAETKANPPAAAPAPVVEAPPPPAPAPVVDAPPPPPPAPVVAARRHPRLRLPSSRRQPPPPVNPLKKPATKPVAPAATPAPSTAVFPTAIAPAYAGEKPGMARQKTCLDQYNANKATNANGGLKWIQKGGGYYSECNKRLKGGA